MKKLFTLCIAILCAVSINAQISESGNGFVEAFNYDDGTIADSVTYEGLNSEWPEESSVMAGVLKWDQGDEGETWLGFSFENAMDVSENLDFTFMYQLPAGTALCIYMADADGGEAEICPENLFLGTDELMSAKIDLADAEGVDVSKVIEVGFLSWTPTAGTLYIDDVVLGDATVVGFNRTSIQNTLEVYPNPASREFRIDRDIKSLSIFNSIGQEVFSMENYLSGSPINTREFKEGLYIIMADDLAHKLMVE